MMREMSWGIAIMYLVAALFGMTGTTLLLRLRGTVSERQVYAFRMVGIMAVAAAITLAASATAMWRWTFAP